MKGDSLNPSIFTEAKARKACTVYLKILLVLLGAIYTLANNAAVADSRKYPPLCSIRPHSTDGVVTFWGTYAFTGLGDAWECPNGAAVMVLDYVNLNDLRSELSYNLVGSCCPLPEGALLDTHVIVPRECPDGYVVTGGKMTKGAKEVTHPNTVEEHTLRCTKVNSARFQLGPETSGWTFGPTTDRLQNLVKLNNKKETFTERNRIPVALRYGLLRYSAVEWSDQGCIGHPWGSIMTAKRHLNCPGIAFRELMEKQADGKLIPAPVYQPCNLLDDPYSPTPKCIDPAVEGPAVEGPAAEGSEPEGKAKSEARPAASVATPE